MSNKAFNLVITQAVKPANKDITTSEPKVSETPNEFTKMATPSSSNHNSLRQPISLISTIDYKFLSPRDRKKNNHLRDGSCSSSKKNSNRRSFFSSFFMCCKCAKTKDSYEKGDDDDDSVTNNNHDENVNHCCIKKDSVNRKKNLMLNENNCENNNPPRLTATPLKCNIQNNNNKGSILPTDDSNDCSKLNNRAEPGSSTSNDLILCTSSNLCSDDISTSTRSRASSEDLQDDHCNILQQHLPFTYDNEINSLEKMNDNFLNILDPLLKDDANKICLVIDLDETLVHSSFEYVENYDFTVDVEIDGEVHVVYVLKRPHVLEFLNVCGSLFECVLFTASLSKYADPVTDKLDPESRLFRHRLFRESCQYHLGSFVKNLSNLGRNIKRVCILDNSSICYLFHQENAIPILSWFDDLNDDILEKMIPYIQDLSKADNVIDFLRINRPPGLEYLQVHELPSLTSHDIGDDVQGTVFARTVNEY